MKVAKPQQISSRAGCLVGVLARGLAVFSLTVGPALTSGVAHAHPALDRGATAADEGDFERALEQFDAALRSGRLTRAELVELLGKRALVHFALRRQRAVTDDLRTLLAIEPGYDFGGTAPPQLVLRVGRLRRVVEPLGVDVQVEERAGGVLVRARTHGVRARAGFALQVGVRDAGGRWRRTGRGSLFHPAPVGGTVEYYAALRGPGGALLVSDGTARTPWSHRVVGPSLAAHAGARRAGWHPERAASPSAREGQRSERRSGLWWGIGGASALLVAAGVVAVVLTAADGDPAVRAPTVEFP